MQLRPLQRAVYTGHRFGTQRKMAARAYPTKLPDCPRHKDLYPSIDYTAQLKNSLSGYKVLITGASSGCGQAMAVGFAHAGASDLFLTARKKENLEQTESQVAEVAPQARVHSYALDIQNEAQVDTVVPDILQAAGKLDCVISNAGCLEEWKLFAESDPKEWWSTWEINVRGSYLVTRLCTQNMLQHGGGTVILLSSAGSLIVRHSASAYQMSKLAMNRLADFIDRDHAEQGIRAFAVHPGGVSTSLARNMPKEMHAALTDSPRLGAGMCVYLCTPSADFLRGRYVSSSWDIPTLEGRKEDILAKDLLKMKLTVE